jgi:hypothetical protein
MVKTSQSSKKYAKLDHSGAIFVVLFGNASISRVASALVHVGRGQNSHSSRLIKLLLALAAEH